MSQLALTHPLILKEKKRKEKKSIFKRKEKKRKRKRNNDLADLPSHDINYVRVLALLYCQVLDSK